MDLQKLILSSLWDSGLAEIAKSLWQDNSKAKDTLNTTLGFVFKWLEKNASTPKWANDIAKAAEKHENSFLTNIGENISKWDVDLFDWEKILWHIFWDKTEVVESTIANNTWVSKNKISNLLKTVAPMVLSSITTEKQSDWTFNINKLSETLTWSSESATSQSTIAVDIVNAVISWEIKNIDDIKNIAIRSSWGILKTILQKLFGRK